MPFDKTKLRRIILAVVIFVMAYSVFLLGWIKVKNYYAAVLVRAGAYLVALLEGATVDEVKKTPDGHEVLLAKEGYSPKGFGIFQITLPFRTSTYTFNVPLTLALVATLSFFLPLRRWAWAEALGILVLMHALYVFSFGGLQFYYGEVKVGLRPASGVEQFFWEFFWAFMDNMVIRFEPFLVAIYLYFRAYPHGKTSLKVS